MKCKTEGLTLVEILIVIAILGTLAVLTFGALPAFRSQSALAANTERAISSLAEARARTLSSEGAQQYGVHFEQDRFVLFAGDTFVAGASGNDATPLPDSVEINDITLSGGGADVVFERLTGETDNDGTVTFRLVDDTDKTRVVRIEKSGTVSVE